jgi:hypothetical protein
MARILSFERKIPNVSSLYLCGSKVLAAEHRDPHMRQISKASLVEEEGIVFTAPSSISREKMMMTQNAHPHHLLTQNA